MIEYTSRVMIRKLKILLDILHYKRRKNNGVCWQRVTEQQLCIYTNWTFYWCVSHRWNWFV